MIPGPNIKQFILTVFGKFWIFRLELTLTKLVVCIFGRRAVSEAKTKTDHYGETFDGLRGIDPKLMMTLTNAKNNYRPQTAQRRPRSCLYQFLEAEVGLRSGSRSHYISLFWLSRSLSLVPATVSETVSTWYD